MKFSIVIKKAPGETYRFGREPFLLFSFSTFRRKCPTTDCVRARRKCLITDCVQVDGGIPSSTRRNSRPPSGPVQDRA